MIFAGPASNRIFRTADCQVCSLTDKISEQTFRKERRRLQGKHLWMEVKLRWNVLLTGCTQRPRLGSHVNNLMHCYSTRLLGAATRIPMRKKPIVDLDLQRSRHGGSNAKSGWNTSRVTVYQQSRLQVLRGKEEVARTEIETFMEHCAKRWQTKEGTYQLKRRRLLQMYQSRQWACNRHSVHGRTKFYRTNWTAARGELFSSLSGSITGLQWNGRSFFQIHH